MKRKLLVFAYTDEPRLEDGGKWIARLSEETNGALEIDINRDLLALQGRAPEVRFGLSEAARETVFREFVWIEDWVAAQQFKREAQEQEVLSRCKDALAAKYGLSGSQLDEIRTEAIVKQWAIPDVPPPEWKPPQLGRNSRKQN